MAILDENSLESKYNNGSTGLFKTGQNRGIGSDDQRSLVTDLKDSTVFKTSLQLLQTATGTNTYAISGNISAYALGFSCIVKFTNASTGASTLNVSSVGAKKIYTNPTSQAGLDDIIVGGIYFLVYDTALDSSNGGFLIVGGVGTGGTASTTIDEVYADIAALLADQGSQEEDNYYWVTDATTDPTVDSGWAIYRKLSGSTGTLATDYVKIQEQESLEIVATPDASTTVAGKVEKAVQSEVDAGTSTGGTGAELFVGPAELQIALTADTLFLYYNFY